MRFVVLISIISLPIVRPISYDCVSTYGGTTFLPVASLAKCYSDTLLQKLGAGIGEKKVDISYNISVRPTITPPFLILEFSTALLP